MMRVRGLLGVWTQESWPFCGTMVSHNILELKVGVEIGSGDSVTPGMCSSQETRARWGGADHRAG